MTKAGTTTSALVSQIDIMGTLASHLGYDLPDTAAEDSHDILPVIKGESKVPRTSHVHNTKAGQYAIRDGDWLLVDAKTGYVSGRNGAWEEKRDYPADDGGDVELYNLKEDIGQKKNMAADQPEKVKELKALLKKLQEQGYSSPRLSK